MTITQSSTRFVAVAAGIALALSLVLSGTPVHAAGLTSGQIQSILSLLQSFGADQATINNVNAALNGQATGGTTGGGTGGACPTLSRSLQVGSDGADVKSLQVFLNSSATTQVASAGAGSPGNESTYFGGLTKAAVIKFQAANGVSAIGIVGPATRAAIAAVCGGTNPNPGPGPAGTVTVSAGAQPLNGQAVASAARVPFTNFTLTNNSGSAVTINSVTVRRSGIGVDADFSGVVLLDSNGLQIGNAKTFNSNHEANVGDVGFTLQPGASMTYTVAGNMANSSTAQNGQVVSLMVTSVNTSAAVSGSVPVTGASQTVLTTLTLGAFSTSTSSVVPPTAGCATTGCHTQNVGDAGVRFAGVKFTASSAEDLKLYSIRWRQVGSASSVDISNVTTVANGTTYPASVDSTGKYYTTVFPGGIMIAKGNSVDVYVQGDISGTNSSGRTVQFTVDRATDVYFVGQLYGFGINDTVYPNSQPWYTGDTFSITAGSASTISKSNATADAAQNISVNVQNQALGGFTTNFLGEPVSISGLELSVATSSGFNAGPLTSVSITDDNGAVVAGPVDQSASATNASTASIVFTDTITFPTGMHTYHVKGKVPSGTSNGSTLTVTVTPSNWNNPTGQVTGNSITISNAAFALNQMTVRGATTTITMSSSPSAQNVVAGVQGYTFANVQIDASQSGEDIRMSSLPLTLSGTNAATNLSGCQLYDGATALTTGARVQNSMSAGTVTFSFDNSITIPKGTVKTISVVCNLSSSASANDSVQWTLLSGSSYSASGVTSGVSITPTVASLGASGLQTVQSGSATVGVDSSSPSAKLVAAGSTGVTATVLKFHATNEALNLTKIGLTLTNSGNTKSNGAGGSTHNGADDVIMASIYNGATLVGTATFTGGNTTATSTLNTTVALAKDADTLLTVKVDLAPIGFSAQGGIGDPVKVNALNFEATGASSGTTVSGPTATNTVSTGASALQMFKAYPTVALGTGACVGTNCNGANQTIKRFVVSATSGPIGVAQLTLSIATSSAAISNVRLYAYTDSGYSQGVSNLTSGTGLIQTKCASGCVSAPTLTYSASSTPIQVTSSQPIYFALIGDVTPASGATNWTIISTLLGDSATSSNQVTGYNANSAAAGGVIGNLVWSDNATTTAATNDIDWFNGFQVAGLPSTGI